jgi:hypothetical protein
MYPQIVPVKPFSKNCSTVLQPHHTLYSHAWIPRGQRLCSCGLFSEKSLPVMQLQGSQNIPSCKFFGADGAVELLFLGVNQFVSPDSQLKERSKRRVFSNTSSSVRLCQTISRSTNSLAIYAMPPEPLPEENETEAKRREKEVDTRANRVSS